MIDLAAGVAIVLLMRGLVIVLLLSLSGAPHVVAALHEALSGCDAAAVDEGCGCPEGEECSPVCADCSCAPRVITVARLALTLHVQTAAALIALEDEGPQELLQDIAPQPVLRGVFHPPRA